MALVQNSSGEKQQNWDFPGGPEIKNLPCGDRKEGRREREGHSERQRKKKGGRQGKRERDGGGGRKEQSFVIIEMCKVADFCGLT